MEARTGNSAPEKPVAKEVRVVPLKSITFTRQVPIPGFRDMASYVEVGLARTDEGKQKQFPQPFLDMALRTVVIADRHYPLEMVVCFERAKAALTKLPEPPPQPDYTIGKRESRTKKTEG